MNGIDLLIIALVLVALVLAIRYSRKHPDCSGNCASCHTSSCNKKPGEVPDFVKAYRADHSRKS